MKNQIDIEDSVIFFGAGVSLNSGIPIVKNIVEDGKIVQEGLVDVILDNICSEHDDKVVVKEAGLPFEGFIETLMLTGNIDPILDIFEIGNPNHFHKLMAELAMIGKVVTFVTTNFDRHLEDAMTSLGMVEGKNYIVTVIEPHTEFARTTVDELVTIYKLHGDINNRDNLGITLRNVSSKPNQIKISAFFNFFDDTFAGKKIYFFGYSCSDEFDITPALEKLGGDQNSHLSVQFIDHNRDVTLENALSKCISEESLFNNWSGEKISVDTDNYLASLAKSYQLNFEIDDFSDSQWKNNVAAWAGGISPLHELVMGQLFVKISEFSLAEKYFLKFINAYPGDPAVLAEAYRLLSNTQLMLQKYDSAMVAAQNAKRIATLHGEINLIVHAEGAIGLINTHLSNFKSAIESLKVAVSTDSENSDSTKVSSNTNKALIMANLATCYLETGDNENYFVTAQHAQELAENVGDINALHVCARNNAKMCKQNADYSNAVEVLLDAYKLARKIGNNHFSAVTQQDLGDCYHKLGDIDKAKSAYGSATVYFESMGNSLGVGLVKGNMGFLYCEENSLDKAKECFKEAIEVVDDVNKSNYYTALGGLLYDEGELDQAINYHFQAIKLAKENLQALYNAKNSLGTIYLDFGNHDEAKNTVAQALDIANRLGNKVYQAQSNRWMALTLWCLREDDLSVEYAKTSYDILYDLFGENHPKTVQSLETLRKVLG